MAGQFLTDFKRYICVRHFAMAELKLCRSEWNENRETFRPSFPSFSRATPSAMP